MQMEQSICLSLCGSASVSLLWPFSTVEFVLWRVVLKPCETEAFNSYRRKLFSWILITLIKGIDWWNWMGFLLLLCMYQSSTTEPRYSLWAFILFAHLHFVSHQWMYHVTIYKLCWPIPCSFVFAYYIWQGIGSINTQSQLSANSVLKSIVELQREL